GLVGRPRPRHRLDPDRHDPPVPPGGWMKARYLLGAALFPLMMAAAAAQPAKLPPADSPILLQGDQIIYDGDAETESVVGHVEMDDGGYILLADSVTYDQKTDKVTARGHISLTDPKGNVAFANEMVLTDRMRNGALTGFGALIGENGRLAAASAQRIGGNTVIANHTAYTPCKICDLPGQRTPVWQVKSERVVYDQEKHRIHFYNATLDFFGVPVLYTPFLSEPDPTIRYASGLLAPDVGNS